MANNCKDYFVEEDNGEFYVYNDYDELVYIASSIQSLNDFCPGLGDLQESIEMSRRKKPVSRKAWDPDKHLEEVCKYYRNWAGFDEDEILTEDLLKNEDWRLKRVSSLKNMPVDKIKKALLKSKDSDED